MIPGVTGVDRIQRSSTGGEAMRASQNTIKHENIRIPTIRDLKDLAEKAFHGPKAADAVLFTVTAGLYGWLLYCLARPFLHYQLVF